MIKEIIVVEGKDDTTAIKRAVEAETIETGGSAINKDIIKRIKLAQQRRGVIVLTDPDHAGERIRKIITAQVPGCKHAFITQENATSKGDIGVENASVETIREALSNLRTDYESAESDITLDDLVAAGLIVHPQAASRRMAVGKVLGIGYCNGKQFYKRCRMFQITREEFAAAWRQLDKEEG
ncbi:MULTISPECIES: ribonuclease M5 [Paenibacillus]|uniref:Ribonuclease M5 n=1 Tax=Paenibacillus radicis (ex Xue et al. 2023) TaxID=2972489 RepID=A0ABT1YTR5_9BACL|nr:ribonuclease M5 [Paenibacillus radicis (ex Xue et al. 2023)]MCR8636095.1 ribonuclease M5 [Paenibacillus radicis (ex Xue et al. 2023)]